MTVKDKLKQLLIWSFEGGLGVQGLGFMVRLLGSNLGAIRAIRSFLGWVRRGLWGYHRS